MDRRREASRARVPVAGRRHPGDSHERRSGPGSARGRARSLRVRRGAHPQPDRALARTVRRARRLPRISRLFRARPVPGVPELLAALHEDRSVRHPRRPLGVRARCLADIAESPMPGSPPTPNISVDYLREFRATIAGRLDTVDHWVFPTPERGRLLPSCLRSRSRSGRHHRARFDHPARPAAGGARRAAVARRAVTRRLRGARLGEEGSRRGERAGGSRSAARASRSTIFGPLKQPASPELHAHGAYDNELLPELLHRAGIQVVLLPGAYAETFGIVMSESLVGRHPGDRRDGTARSASASAPTGAGGRSTRWTPTAFAC